jgi:HAMP domain-containing protein
MEVGIETAAHPKLIGAQTVGIGLRGRILSLAGLPILGLLFVLAVEHIASTRLGEANVAFSSQRDLASLADKLMSEAGAMRIAADGFRRSRDENSEKAFLAAHAVAAGTLDGLTANASAEHASDVTRLRENFAEFSNNFSSYVAIVDRVGRTNHDGLTAGISSSGLMLKRTIHNAESALGPLSSSAKEAVSDLLIAERDFRAHQTYAFVSNFDRLSSQLNQMIEPAILPREFKDKFNESYQDYKSTFSELLAELRSAEMSFNSLKQNHAALGEQLAVLQASFNNKMSAARNDQESIAGTQRMWVIAAFAGVVLLSAVLALTIGVQLSRNMGRLSTAMGDLATGDTTKSIPSFTSRDELAVMARALKVLRDGVEERQRLVSQQAEASGARLERAQNIEAKIRAFEADIGQSR